MSRSRPAGLLLVLALTVVALSPSPVPAFDCLCVEPEDAAHPLWYQSHILWGWLRSDMPVTWAVMQYNSPDGIATDLWYQAVARSFATWSYPNVSTTYLEFSPAPLSETGTGGAIGVAAIINPDDPQWESFSPFRTSPPPPDHDGTLNMVVVMRDAWTAKFAADGLTLAITEYAFNGSAPSWNIIGADIFLNGHDKAWSVTGEADKFDVQSVLTHEIGHVLGLAHADAEHGRLLSTMFPTAGAGETDKASLEEDDRNGLTYLYPRDGLRYVAPDRNTVGLLPLANGSSSSGGGGGCSVGPDSTAAAAVGFLLSLLPVALLLGWLRLRAVAVALPLLLWAAAPAGATVVIRQNLLELTLASTTVARARIASVRSDLLDGHVCRIVDAVVLEPIKGDGSPSLRIVTPGGLLGDRGVGVPGAAGFVPGEEVVVFLGGSGPLRTVTGMAQGKFLVDRAGLEPLAVQDARGLCLLDVRPPSPGEQGGPSVPWAAGAISPGSVFSVPLRTLMESLRSFVAH